MPEDDLSRIARRMEAAQAAAGVEESLERDPWQPRWRIDPLVVEFECGCRGERCRQLFDAKPYDPVIFRDLEEQAVYDFVCDRHLPGMNKYVRFGGFVDFQQWKANRRKVLMGRVKA